MVAGTFVYIFLREKPPPLLDIFPGKGVALPGILAEFFQQEWILFNLPDGLWLYSFCCSVFLLWRDSFELRWSYCSAACIVAAGSEILQLWGTIPGTWDPMDLTAYGLAVPLSWLACRGQFCSNQSRKKGEHHVKISSYYHNGNRGTLYSVTDGNI